MGGIVMAKKVRTCIATSAAIAVLALATPEAHSAFAVPALRQAVRPVSGVTLNPIAGIGRAHIAVKSVANTDSNSQSDGIGWD